MVVVPCRDDRDLHLRRLLSLDGFGSYEDPGDWGGYWGKQGPEFLDHRLAVLSEQQRMVLGAKHLLGAILELLGAESEESEAPLRSHGSLSMNRALLTAGLVDRVQVSIFPVITGQTGVKPIFEGASEFDLELIESRTFDGRIQELVYRPTLH